MTEKEKTRFNQESFNLSVSRLNNHLKKHSGGFNKIINAIINQYSKNAKKVEDNEEKKKDGEHFENMCSRIFAEHLHEKRKINVLATKHVSFIAHNLKKALASVGISSDVIYDEPERGYDNCLHIVLCPQMFERLPDLYFVFQLEQHVSKRWMTEKYFKLLSQAISVIDYSLDNINYFINNGFSYKQLYYLPIRPVDVCIDKGCYEYDVLFYGDMSSDRRKIVLSKLQKEFNVKICTEVFGEELYREISKAKVVVNIHFYENALLESTRLSELISLGKMVVSEEGVNKVENDCFRSYVKFVPEGDVESLIKEIRDLLKSDPEEYKVRLKKDFCSTKFNEFTFYFYRFLLSFDLITFDQFYYSIGQWVDIPKTVCLSLTESISRKKAFLERYPDIYIFQGLRHYIGWKGTGLSYKFLMKRAKDKKYEMLTVCEDDVVLPENWNGKQKEILQRLKEKDWDIFTGLIADAHKDCKIISCEDVSIGKLVSLDKIVSMVFCCYSENIYDKMLMWDHYSDSVDNTIDRYLQNLIEIKAYCLLPYFVSMAEAKSTLWNGVDNDVYKKMTKESERFLLEKVELFNRQIVDNSK